MKCSSLVKGMLMSYPSAMFARIAEIYFIHIVCLCSNVNSTYKKHGGTKQNLP